MRIAVVGAGALGGFYGGLLARAGEDVTFLARRQTLAILQQQGLTVRSLADDPWTIAVAATDDPASVGAVDLVFLAVKTYDLDGAIDTVRPLVGRATAILCVQNGITGPERIGAAFGHDQVIAGAVYVSATVPSPGVIVREGGPGLIHLGELSGGRTPRLERVAMALSGASVPIQLHDDIHVPLWNKFMAICAMSGMTALCRLTLRQIFAEPVSRQLYYDVMAEVVAVARAEGVALSVDAADTMLQLLLTTDQLPERGSMAYDLLAGRRLELPDLNGTVVRRGKRVGIPTPINRVIDAALRPYVNGDPHAAP